MVVVMKNVVMDTEKLMRGKSGREGNMKGTKTEKVSTDSEEESDVEEGSDDSSESDVDKKKYKK